TRKVRYGICAEGGTVGSAHRLNGTGYGFSYPDVVPIEGNVFRGRCKRVRGENGGIAGSNLSDAVTVFQSHPNIRAIESHAACSRTQGNAVEDASVARSYFRHLIKGGVRYPDVRSVEGEIARVD